MLEYNIVGASNDEVQQAIEKKWGNNPEEKEYAEQIALIAGDYSRNLPKSFNQDKLKKKEFRRNARRRIKEQAVAQVKPVGFIPGFLFMSIISGIVSWFVQRLLNHYFNESPKGMFYEDFVKGENDVGDDDS